MKETRINNENINQSIYFSENEYESSSVHQPIDNRPGKKNRVDSIDSDESIHELENPALIGDLTSIDSTQPDSNPQESSLSLSTLQNPPLYLAPPVASSSPHKNPPELTLPLLTLQNSALGLLPHPDLMGSRSTQSLGKRKKLDQATSTYRDNFYIEYLNYQNETLRVSSTNDVLNLIFNYFTNLPNTLESAVKEITDIRGNFDLLIKVPDSLEKLNDQYVYYKNHINPRFYCYTGTENSSLMAYFYLFMMALIESESSKKISFEDTLLNTNIYTSSFLRLSKHKQTSTENIPKNFLCYIGIIKKFVAESRGIRSFRTKKDGIKTSIVDFFNIENSLFESVKRELLIGTYCCLEKDHQALNRLEHCFLNSLKIEDDGLGLKNILRSIKKSEEIAEDKISITDPRLEELRFPKKRNLPRKEIARDKISSTDSLLKFRLPARENLSRKSKNLIESIDREIEVETAQEKKAAKSDTDVDNITSTFAKLQINDGERETEANQRVQDVENHSVPSIIRPRPIAVTHSAVINVTTTSQPQSQNTIQLANSLQSAFKNYINNNGTR